jgi:hypothetical protein
MGITEAMGITDGTDIMEDTGEAAGGAPGVTHFMAIRTMPATPTIVVRTMLFTGERWFTHKSGLHWPGRSQHRSKTATELAPEALPRR